MTRNSYSESAVGRTCPDHGEDLVWNSYPHPRGHTQQWDCPVLGCGYKEVEGTER